MDFHVYFSGSDLEKFTTVKVYFQTMPHLEV